jgi:putative transcriptional regulator
MDPFKLYKARFAEINKVRDGEQSVTNLSRQWLLAMPSMIDDMFTRSTIYLCLHDAEGAMGFVTNKEASFTLADVFKQLELAVKAPKKLNNLVLCGGPIHQEQGFVLHDGSDHWSGSKRLSPTLVLSPGQDLLAAIAADADNLPANYQVFFGYSSWSQGQLEEEIMDNSWLTANFVFDPTDMVDLNHHLIFSQPITERWQQAAYSLGVGVSQLGWQAGSA